MTSDLSALIESVSGVYSKESDKTEKFKEMMLHYQCKYSEFISKGYNDRISQDYAMVEVVRKFVK